MNGREKGRRKEGGGREGKGDEGKERGGGDWERRELDTIKSRKK